MDKANATATVFPSSRLRGVPLSAKESGEPSCAGGKESERSLTTRFGVSPSTLARAVAGFGLRRGTVVLLSTLLRETKP